jgi:hypothetical protein
MIPVFDKPFEEEVEVEEGFADAGAVLTSVALGSVGLVSRGVVLVAVVVAAAPKSRGESRCFRSRVSRSVIGRVRAIIGVARRESAVVRKKRDFIVKVNRMSAMMCDKRAGNCAKFYRTISLVE